MHVDLETGRVETLRRTSDHLPDPANVSRPETFAIRWTWAGTSRRRCIRVLLPPKAVPTRVPTAPGPRSWCWPRGADTRPAQPGTDHSILTNRGIAVADINYSSTGYERLPGTPAQRLGHQRRPRRGRGQPGRRRQGGRKPGGHRRGRRRGFTALCAWLSTMCLWRHQPLRGRRLVRLAGDLQIRRSLP